MDTRTSPRIPDFARESEIEDLIVDALALRPRVQRLGIVTRITFDLDARKTEPQRPVAPATAD